MGAVVAVGAVIVQEDGAVLLVKRGRAPLRGAWSLPGGKVEPGEALSSAICREVLEETGLLVTADECIDVVTLSDGERAFEIHEFVCHLAPGADPSDVRPGDDADGVVWRRPEELAGLGVTREVQRVVALALKR